MAANDASMDQVFSDWDEKRIKLQSSPVEQQAAKLGPWAKLVGQRMQIFVDRWRPDRMKVMKRLGSNNNVNADAIRGHLTPLARDEFIADLRAWGIPDRYAHAAGALIEVR